jgi:hypothetical protein
MNSGGHRGFTVVTIIVLVFAPFFSHHDWVWRLIGQTKGTRLEQCAPKQPCPARKVIVSIERLPIPVAGGHGGGSDQSGGGGSDNGQKGKH